MLRREYHIIGYDVVLRKHTTNTFGKFTKRVFVVWVGGEGRHIILPQNEAVRMIWSILLCCQHTLSRQPTTLVRRVYVVSYYFCKVRLS